MSVTEIYECACGVTRHQPKGMGVPKGWQVLKIRCKDDLLCGDCVDAIKKSIPTLLPNAAPQCKGFGPVIAFPKPVRGVITLDFPDGDIDLTLAESEAIANALVPAIQIMRGKHPAQAGGRS